MIDNFEQIKGLLTFTDPKHFYFLQILKRKKENPGMKKDTSVIDNFFFYSAEDLVKLKPKIVKLCEDNNARAYIRLNVCDSEVIALKTINIISKCSMDKDYRGAKSAYLSACGDSKLSTGTSEKKWIIDVDTKDNEFVTSVIDHLLSIDRMIIHAKIETKSGFHIITGGFDPRLFTAKFPKVDIKSSNEPTVLYVPYGESLEAKVRNMLSPIRNHLALCKLVRENPDMVKEGLPSLGYFPLSLLEREENNANEAIDRILDLFK